MQIKEDAVTNKNINYCVHQTDMTVMQIRKQLIVVIVTQSAAWHFAVLGKDLIK